MKKLNLLSLLLGAALFATMTTTTLSAEAMKCGAGKCGASVEKQAMKKPACCEAKSQEMKKPACCEAKAAGKACTCPKAIECTCKDKNNCVCEAGQKAKIAPKEAMKCGTGKCG